MFVLLRLRKQASLNQFLFMVHKISLKPRDWKRFYLSCPWDRTTIQIISSDEQRSRPRNNWLRSWMVIGLNSLLRPCTALEAKYFCYALCCHSLKYRHRVTVIAHRLVDWRRGDVSYWLKNVSCRYHSMKAYKTGKLEMLTQLESAFGGHPVSFGRFLPLASRSSDHVWRVVRRPLRQVNL